MSDEIKQKPWLQRTEGKFGTAVTLGVLGAGIGLGLYFWGLILPWLVMMLANTLTAMALAAAVAAIMWVLIDPQWRNLAAYGYKSLMRALTSAFITIDPIGILKNYVATLSSRLEELDASLGELNGQQTKLKAKIEKNEADRIHSLKRAQEAQKIVKESGTSEDRQAEMQEELYVQIRQAGRLNTSNVKLQDIYKRMGKLAYDLKRVRNASAILIRDTTNEVNSRTDERATILAGYNVMMKAQSIMQGGGNEREMFDMAMEDVVAEVGMKTGQIEAFADMTKSFVNGSDLDNRVFEMDALAQLDEWSKKQRILEDTDPHGVVAPEVTGHLAGVRVEAPQDNFADLFEGMEDTSTKKTFKAR